MLAISISHAPSISPQHSRSAPNQSPSEGTSAPGELPSRPHTCHLPSHRRCATEGASYPFPNDDMRFTPIPRSHPAYGQPRIQKMTAPHPYTNTASSGRKGLLSAVAAPYRHQRTGLTLRTATAGGRLAAPTAIEPVPIPVPLPSSETSPCAVPAAVVAAPSSPPDTQTPASEGRRSPPSPAGRGGAAAANSFPAALTIAAGIVSRSPAA